MNKESVKHSRWEKAQQYERKFWEKQADYGAPEASKRFSWYQQRAKMVFGSANRYLKGFDRLVALEIGPGPIGLINYLEADERYALDPLENFNKTIPEVVDARNPQVNYRQGTGENVSELNKTFNFAILDNVLDHCRNPVKVLSEIYNNLEPSGVLFFSINVYTPFGVMIRNAMELFEIDKGHPFNFSEKSICSLLKQAGYDILDPKKSDYRTQKMHYRKSNRTRDKIKSYLGLTDSRFSAICIRK